MDLFLMGKASIIGLSIAAPVGPIGLLCIQRTLSAGARSGIASGLGAATADAIYGAIGAFGLTVLTQFFTSIATPLALLGGLFLIWIGAKCLRASPAASAEVTLGGGGIRAFGSTLLLTLANPMTILSFVAVFSALSGTSALTSQSAMTMVIGVFIGSALWWLMLSGSVALLRHKISRSVMAVINRAAGMLLLLFGLWQLYSVAV